MARARPPWFRWMATGATLGLLSLWCAAGCGNLIGLNEYEELDEDPDDGGGDDCGDPGDECESASDCCGNDICVLVADGAAVCAAECAQNAECSSGCCQGLEDGGGACAPLATCGGPGCRAAGNSCDATADCCDADTEGTVCVDFDTGGPSLCAATCVEDIDCRSVCCAELESGSGACGPAEFCE